VTQSIRRPTEWQRRVKRKFQVRVCSSICARVNAQNAPIDTSSSIIYSPIIFTRTRPPIYHHLRVIFLPSLIRTSMIIIYCFFMPQDAAPCLYGCRCFLMPAFRLNYETTLSLFLPPVRLRFQHLMPAPVQQSVQPADARPCSSDACCTHALFDATVACDAMRSAKRCVVAAAMRYL